MLRQRTMIFTYGDHALLMLHERKIEREWVERTVLEPDTTEPDPNHPDRMRAFRTVPECNDRVLRVVYIQQKAEYRVVTLFFDRGRSQRK